MFDDSGNRRRERRVSLFSGSCWFAVFCLDADGELIEDVDELEDEELDEGRDDVGML